MMCWSYWKTIFTPVATTPKQVKSYGSEKVNAVSSSKPATLSSCPELVINAAVLIADMKSLSGIACLVEK